MKRRRDNWLKTRSMADGIKLEPVCAPDGDPLEVLSNVSSPEHVKTSVENGAEGIGAVPHRISVYGQVGSAR